MNNHVYNHTDQSYCCIQVLSGCVPHKCIWLKFTECNNIKPYKWWKYFPCAEREVWDNDFDYIICLGNFSLLNVVYYNTYNVGAFE